VDDRATHVGLVAAANEALREADDFLDALSRLYDIEPRPPVFIDGREFEPEIFADGV